MTSDEQADFDDLLGLALAVANGWPRDTAPEYVRAEYIEALKDVARRLTRKHPARVALLRARNAAELASERSGV